MVRSAHLHILIDYRAALRQRTGVGEYVHQLTTAALRQLGSGERVTLFSSSWKDRLTDVPAGAAVCDLRIPVTLLNAAWHRLEWPPVDLLGIQPDVTWSLHPLLTPVRRAVQAITVHDLYFLDRPGDTVREIRRDYAPLVSRHAQRAGVVIVNSDYTRQQVVERLQVPPQRIAVCHPGAPAVTPRPAPVDTGPILHIGTIEPRKNVPALLEAYAELVRAKPHVPALVFAGKAPDDHARLLPAGLEPRRVQFLGYVDDEQKAAWLSQASMLVVPSTEEGFGIPALEAMAAGVPVVAARRGALPEVLGDAGFFCEPDHAELAAAMGTVLQSDDLRRTLRERGIARAAQFSWDRSAATLLDAFRTAHARGSRA